VKTYYVYMIRCADGSFYVGITNDVEKRLGEHNFGLNETCYTYTRRPVELVHCSDFHEVEQAISWEKQLKGWSRAKKIALISRDWERIRRLSRSRPSTGSSFDKLRMTHAAQDDTRSSG
jgi:putative endonuclease